MSKILSVAFHFLLFLILTYAHCVHITMHESIASFHITKVRILANKNAIRKYKKLCISAYKFCKYSLIIITVYSGEYTITNLNYRTLEYFSGFCLV